MEQTRALEILHQTQDTLEMAEFGLKMVVSKDPSFRLVGLRNLIVFGRAVTNILQQLRSVTQDFQPWYEVWEKRMRADPIMKYFYQMRSEILKEGRMRTEVRAGNTALNSQSLKMHFLKPPGAKNFFIIDQQGGSGWEVELPNGEIEKFYVQIPDALPNVKIKTALHLKDAPEEIRNSPIPQLARHYYGQLEEIYNDAWERFSGEE